MSEIINLWYFLLGAGIVAFIWSVTNFNKRLKRGKDFLKKKLKPEDYLTYLELSGGLYNE